MANNRDLPVGVMLLSKLTGKCLNGKSWNRNFWNKCIVLIITFLSYMSYHLTRKPISVVKNVLHQNCSNPDVTPSHTVVNENDTSWCDWVPFDGDNAEVLLGILDSSFLFAYAIAMFISGLVAERVNLRYFLSLGMIFSGLFCYLFGIAKSLNIHSLYYFIFIQIFMGIFQTTGWPAVVAIIGHWFGKGKRGLIFGIWNSHTSIGNILGTLIAGYYVETNWGNSFIMPGLIMAMVGFIVFLFLVVYPEDVGCTPPDPVLPSGINVASYSPLPIGSEDENSSSDEGDDDTSTQVVVNRLQLPYRRNRSSMNEKSPILSSTPQKAIGFIGALKIPGVVEFSLSLFFSKLVSYTFLFWLPKYINSSTTLSPSLSAQVSTLFDVGGIFGAIVAGVVSDTTGMSATTCTVMLILAVPSLAIYQSYAHVSEAVNIILLMISGAFVNGPYALITTAVSAELGTHESLQGNAKALATVTGIIDGTGSIGAAIGPLLAGVVSQTGWDYVFYLLMLSDVLALLLLTRLTYRELSKFRDLRRFRAV